MQVACNLKKSKKFDTFGDVEGNLDGERKYTNVCNTARIHNLMKAQALIRFPSRAYLNEP